MLNYLFKTVKHFINQFTNSLTQLKNKRRRLHESTTS
nr:MAG TPA: hypothetical protein [Caudoviricetes sp.]